MRIYRNYALVPHLHTIYTLLLTELTSWLVCPYSVRIFAFHFDRFGIDFRYGLRLPLHIVGMYTLNILVECWVLRESVWSVSLCCWYIHMLWGTQQVNRRSHRHNFKTIDKCWFASAMHWSILYRWFWVSLFIDVRFLSPIHSVRDGIKLQRQILRLFRMIKKTLCALHCTWVCME